MAGRQAVTQGPMPILTDEDVERWAKPADLHLQSCDAPTPAGCRMCRERLDMWRAGFEAAAPAMRARGAAEALGAAADTLAESPSNVGLAPPRGDLGPEIRYLRAMAHRHLAGVL